jgi:hypothetical protein
MNLVLENKMQCWGNPSDDRICDLCKATNLGEYLGCHQKYDDERKKYNRQQQIMSECLYCKQCWDEYTPFDGCTKDGGGGRFTPNCIPTEECAKFKKGEIK